MVPPPPVCVTFTALMSLMYGPYFTPDRASFAPALADSPIPSRNSEAILRARVCLRERECLHARVRVCACAGGVCLCVWVRARARACVSVCVRVCLHKPIPIYIYTYLYLQLCCQFQTGVRFQLGSCQLPASLLRVLLGQQRSFYTCLRYGQWPRVLARFGLRLSHLRLSKYRF